MYSVRMMMILVSAIVMTNIVVFQFAAAFAIDRANSLSFIALRLLSIDARFAIRRSVDLSEQNEASFGKHLFL
jgi:hypothetical protein